MTDAMSKPFKAPFFRRLSTVVIMTISLLFMPVAAILIWTGDIYKKQQGGWQPISNKARYVYGGILALWLVAATLKGVLQPGGIEEQWRQSADPSFPASKSEDQTVGTGLNMSDRSREAEAQRSEERRSDNEMPADQLQYFSKRSELMQRASGAEEGTRSYSEAWAEIESHNASLNGTQVTDWICTLPAQEYINTGTSKLAYCLGGKDRGTRFELWFDDPSVIQGTAYPGDVIQFSGSFENRGQGWIRIHPTSAAIIQKSR